MGETLTPFDLNCSSVIQAPPPPVTWVKEGGTVRLGRRYLKAAHKGVSSDDVVYAIVTSGGEPKHGTTSRVISEAAP